MGTSAGGASKENGPTAAMQQVAVPLRWIRDVQRNSMRWIAVSVMLPGILADLKDDRRDYWTARVRAIDTTNRSLYDGHKVNESHNVSQPTGDKLDSERPT